MGGQWRMWWRGWLSSGVAGCMAEKDLGLWRLLESDGWVKAAKM